MPAHTVIMCGTAALFQNAVPVYADSELDTFNISPEEARNMNYGPYVELVLDEENVPTELFYLAMIESGLNPKAYSYALASGIWQFISSTGERRPR